MVYLCALLLVEPVSAIIVQLDQDFTTPVSTGEGGRTLLVEEYTATWCSVCSEVDPELETVADSHGSRIAIIALHPTDGDDAFEPAAAAHRIERMKTVNPSIASTPTFVVEGGTPRGGYEAWQDVQRDILNTELERQKVTPLSFEVQATDSGYKASVINTEPLTRNGTQLTFLVVQHGAEVPERGINVGGSTRDRVLLGTAECNLETGTLSASIGLLNATTNNTCSADFSIEFPKYDSWSVILVHEHTLDALRNGSEPMSYGAVEMAHRSRSVEQSSNVSWVLIGLCAALSLVAIGRRK
jgi:thiol-disulfide isomerase/thioredoxin